MEVSVIIPVYNAAKYVEFAVESALNQAETREIILIEDGSSDGSLQKCQKLADKYSRVIIQQHQGHKNCGAAASRNLGLRIAQSDFIAFLDADDYYLPERFTNSKRIFHAHLECDGVYEAIGIDFENEIAKEVWINSPMANIEMTTMTRIVDPEELFERLLIGNCGYFSLNGLTIKKDIIKRTGLMNEKLLLHEDTDFIIKLSAVGCLMPGRLNESVAIRQVHADNRISTPITIRKDYRNHIAMWISTYRWLKKQELSEKQELLFHRMVSKSINIKHYDNFLDEYIPESILTRLRLFLTTAEYPELLLEPGYFSKYLPVKTQVRINNQNKQSEVRRQKNEV